MEQIDKVMNLRAKSTCSLISLEKIISVDDIKNRRYNYFVRQFAGDGAPEVDKSFMSSNEINGLQVYYKMA